MSSPDDPNHANELARSVEKDSSAPPPLDSSTIKDAVKGKGKAIQNIKAESTTIPDDARSTSTAKPKQTESETSTVIGSPTGLSELSHPYGRSSSPLEDSYGGFRPPVHDEKGYYASALSRRNGSPSPPQHRRVSSNHSSSPPYVPGNGHRGSTSTVPGRDLFHGYGNSRELEHLKPRRPVSSSYTHPEDDDMEIDDAMPPPRKLLPSSRTPLPSSRTPAPSSRPPLPSSRSSTYGNSVSGTSSPDPVGPRGRTLQRKTSGNGSKYPLSDPYVGVGSEMTSYDDEDEGEDDESEYSARKQPHYERKPMSSGYRRDSQNSQELVRYGRDVDVDEEEYGRGRNSQTPFSRRTIETDDERTERGRRIQTPFRRGEESFETDDENPLFLSATSRRVGSSNYGTAPSSSEYGTPRRFNHDTLLQDTPSPSPAPGSKKRKLTKDTRFNQPGANLAPSRYSGDPNLTWGLNQDPPSVPQNEVSDAALLKRGLTRGAKEKVCKRGYGANDPENVNIVNMKEDGMSFPDIVEKLNEVRVENGRNPSLSVCGVTSRYNRTAPLLFAAEGRQFIPLSKRGKGDVLADGPIAEKPVWNDELDLLLVKIAKDIDKEKWVRVSNEFNRRTGKNITGAIAAQRHTLL
ncbi:hypothetical protein VTL71DRAFT_8991 [Oculimacula yallundae]|uniref:Myb-like domain-containing protein n=1 Tax=Oculimacula yallundae TaxID=86028 RepID=A0ABR4BTI8_9HELO